jgi:hypothetical protein
MRKQFLNWWESKITITPKEHASELLKSLILKNDTNYQIDTFEELKAQFESILREKELHAAKECRLINSYLPKVPSIMEMKVNYEAFDKPIPKN